MHGEPSLLLLVFSSLTHMSYKRACGRQGGVPEEVAWRLLALCGWMVVWLV